MKEDKIYKAAKRRALAKIGFYIHLAAFLLATSAQAAVNLVFTPQFLWFLFPFFGWGIGVGIHGAVVYFACDADFKRRLIEKELRALSGEKFETPLSAIENYEPMNWKNA
jgi:hypothetical protein